MSKISAAEGTILKIQNDHDKVVMIRWLIFVSSIATMFVFWDRYQSSAFLASMTFFFSTFILTTLILSHLQRHLLRWNLYLSLVTLEKNRQILNWKDLPPYRAPDLEGENLDLITATDLYLIGPYSVFHLMDSCITEEGQETLANYLLTKDPLSKIKLRQSKIKELLPLGLFRMKFKLIGKMNARELIRKADLLATFSDPVFQKSFFLIFALLLLAQAINLAMIIGASLGLIKPYFVLNIMFILLLYQLLKNKSGNAFDAGLELQISLERLLPVFKLMESLPIKKDEALDEEFSPFKENPPSLLLKKVNAVVALLSVSANPLLKMLLNILLPWDFGLLIILQSLKKKSSPHLKEWMNALGRLEALISLADFSDRIGGSFPQFLEKDHALYLEARELDHPLMGPEKRVSNSFTIERVAPLGIITGSNMAGKSTFLRTIGLNIALAKAGTTVLAQGLRLQNLSVMSLIKAQDYLEKEMSLFYFEVRRIKEILQHAREASSDSPFLFLVDEIYRGTNNQERYQGGVAYLKEFSAKPYCCGLLTTHDINIAKDLIGFSSVRQYHFSESFSGGELVYSYKINHGICETTNALRIMEKEGLPI